MNSRRRISTALLVLCATTAFAACGSDDADSGATSPSTTESSSDDTGTVDSVVSTDAPDETGAPDGTDASVPSSIVDTEFCRTAAEAESLGDLVEGAATQGPAELEGAVTAALDASKATLALAPDDIVEAMGRNVAYQEAFVALLGQYDFDAAAAMGSDEATDLTSTMGNGDADRTEVRRYLQLECGIADDSNDDSASVTPTT